MKPIVSSLLLLVALLVSSCSSTNPEKPTLEKPTPEVSPPEVSPTQEPTKVTEPEDKTELTRPQQALVIGNGNYEYSSLNNPINDAQEMANRLEQMGFDVVVKTDLDNQAMKKQLQEFGQRLSATQTPESVGFFYFAGHGTQINEQNFLLPTNNAKFKNQQDFAQHAIPTKLILEQMAKNKGMNIIVLDACYEKPYPNSSQNITHGLIRTSPPRGTLIAFATEEGKTVPKGNNLYTKTLLQVLNNAEHKRIEDIFMEVHQQVIQQSAGQQTPWYQASLRKPFCFEGCPNE